MVENVVNPQAPSTTVRDPTSVPGALDKLDAHGEVFEKLVSAAARFCDAGRYREASVATEIAAFFAATHHTGYFTSAALERVLRSTCLAAVPKPQPHQRPSREPRRILHVLTEALSIGGHTRGVWRWIGLDTRRSHSVVLTAHGKSAVPRELELAVSRSKGTVHVMDDRASEPLSRAIMLRRLAGEADLVVLHNHSRDIVPALAFATGRDGIPVSKVDHADHEFWVGSSVVDSLIHFRDASLAVATERRQIRASRCSLLPIPLEPAPRTLGRPEAKQRIGRRDHEIVLLTIATAYKYQTSHSPSFVQALEPLIANHPHLVLVAIGPDPTGEWAAASARVNGRLVALGPRTDTAVFYQAADIYLDSFPFASNTSLLEAGCHGVPLISYSPHRGSSRVFGPGAPGLTGVLIEASTIEDFQRAITTLSLDAASRKQIGDATAEQIRRTHSAQGWLDALDRAYGHAVVAAQEADHGPPDVLPPVMTHLNLATEELQAQIGRTELKYIMLRSIRSLGFVERTRLIRCFHRQIGAAWVGALLPQWAEPVVSASWGMRRRLSRNRADPPSIGSGSAERSLSRGPS